MRSPCKIRRKEQAKVFVLSEALEWMAINKLLNHSTSLLVFEFNSYIT